MSNSDVRIAKILKSCSEVDVTFLMEFGIIVLSYGDEEVELGDELLNLDISDHYYMGFLTSIGRPPINYDNH